MKMKKSFKIMFVLTIAFVLFSSTSFNTIDAKSKEIDLYPLFEQEVTLTSHTTKVDIGFVEVKFIKNFIPADEYPITFNIQLYAEDGKLYIEFDPDYAEFIKDVIIHVHAYEGFIYDISTDQFIYVEVPNSVFKVPHFSRWCFLR